MEVEVVRSPRRRRTIQARRSGDHLRVMIPDSLSTADEERWVAEMVRRAERKEEGQRIPLDQRAIRLARRYDLPVPSSIQWVDNQVSRWGSCSPLGGEVRLSLRLARYPDWVLDYVIVHELAHLSEPYHDRRFWSLVGRYPLTERARGYLMARGEEEAKGEEEEEEAEGER
jgi:predicted metal-dependent hydrolase